MLCEKLIEELSKFNPKADVTTPYSEDICIAYVSKNIDTGEELSKKDTPIIFIEQTDSCPSCIHEYTETGERMCSYYNKPCKLVEECYQYEEFQEYE